MVRNSSKFKKFFEFLICIVFFGFIIWGSKLRGIQIAGYSLFPIRIIAIVALIYAVFSIFLKKKISLDKVEIAAIVLFAVGLFSSIWSPDQSGFLQNFSIYFTNIMVFFIVLEKVRNIDDIDIISFALTINFLIVCGVAIFEAYTGEYISTPQYQYYYTTKNFWGLYMPTAGLGNVNNLAVELLLIMPFALFGTERFGNVVGVLLRIAIIVAGSFSILLTGARTGYIGIVIVIALYYAFRLKTIKGIMKLILATGVLIGFIYLLLDSTNLFSFMFSESIATDNRLRIWKGTIQTIFDYYLLGCGMGSARVANGIYGDPHNYLLEILCEFGIIGLIAFVSLLRNAFPSKGILRKRSAKVSLMFVIVFIVVCICPSSMKEMYIFWALLAVTICNNRACVESNDYEVLEKRFM